MKGLILAVLLCVLCYTVLCSGSGLAPKVNVYTRNLGLWGKENVLICHVSQLSPPPQVTIDLLKNGQVMSHATQSDLAFDGDWYYYLTKHVNFNPVKGDTYTCRVTNRGRALDYEWEPDE